jgi:hypothetical protein
MARPRSRSTRALAPAPAKASRPTAKPKATTAKGKATPAKGKATGAKGKATGAKGKATAAKGKATAATGKATAAKGKVTGKATAATRKATAATPKAAQTRARPTAAPAPPPSPSASASVPAAAATARFTFHAVPLIREATGLSPLLRAQLAVDAEVRTGRPTSPERIPASYLRPGVVRWRIEERGKPVFDVVHDTAFFPDSAEPVGLERIAGVWQATGRGSERGRALDLPRLAWELMRDWPGRRLALPPEPRAGSRWTPRPPEPTSPWPDGTSFV